MTSIATGVADRDTVRHLALPTGILTFAVAAVLSVTGAHDTVEWVVELALEAVVAGLVFGVVVPRGLRHESAGGRGLAMGVAALLLVVPAFWSGLPLLLGAGGVLLGQAGRQARSGAGRATASLLVGLLAVIAYLAIYALDYLHVHGLG